MATPYHLLKKRVVLKGTRTSFLRDTFFEISYNNDIQDAYCKLYNFCMKSLECSTKLKANFKKVKLERDELIAKLDEANNLNKKFKNQISS